MKTAILYSYDTVTHRGCCRFLNPKHAAISAAIYTLNISILVVLLYSWRIGVNIKKYADLQDVYYGVQIAYFAIIGTQLFMIVLSVILLIGIYKITDPLWYHDVPGSADDVDMTGLLTLSVVALVCHVLLLGCMLWLGTCNYFFYNINSQSNYGDNADKLYKENSSLVVPWVIGFITFMALEAVSMVYSNVLRDHVNKQFDALCKAEMAFFISRAIINVFAIYVVMRFCNMLRAGISWKGPEVIEL